MGQVPGCFYKNPRSVPVCYNRYYRPTYPRRRRFTETYTYIVDLLFAWMTQTDLQRHIKRHIHIDRDLQRHTRTHSPDRDLQRQTHADGDLQKHTPTQTKTYRDLHNLFAWMTQTDLQRHIITHRLQRLTETQSHRQRITETHTRRRRLTET